MVDWNRGAQPTCYDSVANRYLPGGAGFCVNDYDCEKNGCIKARQVLESRRKKKCKPGKSGEAVKEKPL
jgi:hypothetical protein